jgi:hypothetical protein
MYDPDLGNTPPLPAERAKLEYAVCHPPVVSKPPFTMVFRAASGFGVADGVSVIVLVAVLVDVAVRVGFVVTLFVNVRVIVRLLVGMRVFVLATVRVFVLATVRVFVLATVRVFVLVGVRVFVLVATRASSSDMPDTVGEKNSVTLQKSINEIAIPARIKSDLRILALLIAKLFTCSYN